MRHGTLIGALCSGVAVAVQGGSAPPLAPVAQCGATDVRLHFQGVVTGSPLTSAFVLPGGTLELEVEPSGGGVVRATTGAVTRSSVGHWHWRAPARPGAYALRVIPACGTDSMMVRAFVLVPATALRGGYLNGFHIGRYPGPPRRRADLYRPPVGFVEVTRLNQDLLLTPHFQLRQFLTKQPGGYPKYVVLDPRLLVKLEYLVGLVREAGYGTAGLHIMSGYRTPAYNQALGNVRYSRHLYGAAADIFIDERPRDGVMDDLDGNGRIDIEDAALLYRLLDRHRGDPDYQWMTGGLAMYPATSAHGPFVHVDVRGYPARW
jgi:Peptidase M15